MITRMYRVTDEKNQFKYFRDKHQANSAHYNHGTYVACFTDSKTNTCHELECDYDGKKTDGEDGLEILKQLMERDSFCGTVYLNKDEIIKLKDGFYHASLSEEGYLTKHSNIIKKIELDKSGLHYPETKREKVLELGFHWYNKFMTHGYVLQIDGNSYTLYRKLNEFPAKIKLDHKNNSKQTIGDNITSFFPVPKLKSETEKKLTPEEEKYLDKALLNAKKKALKEIDVARTKNNKLTA